MQFLLLVVGFLLSNASYISILLLCFPYAENYLNLKGDFWACKASSAVIVQKVYSSPSSIEKQNWAWQVTCEQFHLSKGFVLSCIYQKSFSSINASGTSVDKKLKIVPLLGRMGLTLRRSLSNGSYTAHLFKSLARSLKCKFKIFFVLLMALRCSSFDCDYITHALAECFQWYWQWYCLSVIFKCSIFILVKVIFRPYT